MASRSHGEAKTVLADPRSRMHDDPIAEKRIDNGRMRADRAAAAYPDPGADHAMRADQASGADFGPGTDHRSRVDRHIGLEPGLGVDHGPRRDAEGSKHRSRPHGFRIELGEDQRDGAIGLGRDQCDRLRRNLGGISFGHEARRGSRLGQQSRISRVVQECQRPGPGLIERSNRADSGPEVRSCFSLRARPGHDLGHGRLARGLMKRHRSAHPRGPSHASGGAHAKSRSHAPVRALLTIAGPGRSELRAAREA